MFEAYTYYHFSYFFILRQYHFSIIVFYFSWMRHEKYKYLIYNPKLSKFNIVQRRTYTLLENQHKLNV